MPRTRHSTLIPAAARVVRVLKRAGFAPHPGRIDPMGGKGAVRIKLAVDPGRTRIRVAGGGVQELFLYGPVEMQKVAAVLVEAFGKSALEAVTE